MATRAKARAASDPTSPSEQPAAAPVQPAPPQQRKKQQKGFALHGQPGPARGPHDLRRLGSNRRKGAGKRQRNTKPRGVPTPEKIPTARGESALRNPEVAGTALEWTVHFGAQLGMTQKEVAVRVGVDPKLFTRGRQRKEETGGYDYIEPVGVGAPRLLDPEMELCLSAYVEKVDPTLSLDQYGELAESVEGLEDLAKALSRQTVQRTINDREKEKGKKRITDKEVQVTPFYDNLPRYLDMCASYLELVMRLDDKRFVMMDECPFRHGWGSGRTRARSREGTMTSLAQPHYLSNCTGCFVLGMFPPRVIKCTIRASAFVGDDSMLFMNEEQVCPTVEVEGEVFECYTLDGASVWSQMAAEEGWAVGDQLGRAGRAVDPQTGHFHPQLEIEAIKKGKRWLLGPPSFCMFNYEEVFNFLAQRAVANWKRPGWEPGTLRGPRTLAEVQLALHQWLLYIRQPMPAKLKSQKRYKGFATLEEYYVNDCFQQRGGGRYFTKLFEENDTWKAVVAARAANETDTPYTINFNGKPIKCMNLSMDKPEYDQPGTAEQRNPVSRRSAMLPPRTFGWVSALSIEELKALCGNPLVGGELDDAAASYKRGQKDAFVQQVVDWMKANQEKPELRNLLKAPPQRPKAAGTQKKRKNTPAPGSDGSVDLSIKRPRVPIPASAATGPSVRQSGADRDARRAANRAADRAAQGQN